MKKQFPRFIFFLSIYLTLPLIATAQIVNISDPNLRAAVENALGKISGAPITVDEMATLTQLEAKNANISDLAGLEQAANLVDLNLGRNSISDISQVRSLTNLTHLELRENTLSNVSPVADLTNLTRLGLVGNSIWDISPVEGLTNLTQLYLDNNSVSDISALAGLTSLTHLGLEGNGISDISALTDLTDLIWLRLGDNYISDISPLAGLTRLTWMHLTLNNISDISFLVENTGLGNGDQVLLNDNPLNSSSIKTHIPTLQGRGVTVEFENTANLNFSEPRIVRLVYFLPNDRAPQQDIDTKLDTLIRDVQQFYADEMERHGFEGKTFTFETDENGKAMVHHVNGQFTDSYYHQGTFGKVAKEIAEKFDRPQHIYMVAVDISTESIEQWCGESNRFWDRGGREFIMPASGGCFDLPLAAHELGHTFGLDHDFRNDAYIMSYGSNRNRLSECAAEWLDVNRFFNSTQTSFNESAQINKRRLIQMLPPLAYSSKTVRLRFEVTDTDGLHQAQLIIPTTTRDPIEGSKIKLHGCKSLRGENSSLEFITTELTGEPATEIILQVIDVYGGITRSKFTFTKDDILPDPTNRTATTLETISGDNQHGLPITLLPNPLVVKVTDQNGIALEEVAVLFTITAGGGTLSVERVKTDYAGRAESTLTLGPNFETNTVEVSAEGLTVTFNAVAGAPVDIPDPNLRAAVETALSKTKGDPITPSEIATLARLDARNANINDLTGLEGATNLTRLNLGDNAIKDISVLSGLTNLTDLSLDFNNIRDISVLAGLTKLIGLGLGYNAIKDISILPGLTNLILLDLRGTNTSDLSVLSDLTKLERLYIDSNRISDLSPLSGLTNLTNLGLNDNFISDLSPLRGLINLAWMRLVGNNISDLSPLVANTGLGKGDEVDVRGNPLNYLSIMAHIPALQRRGVTVEFDDTAAKSPDVNGDGNINVLDLISIAFDFGNVATHLATDVNGDGIVSILDLILVAGMFDGAAAAPSTQPQVPDTLTAVEVQGWLINARDLEVRDPIMKRGFLVLEQLLVSLTPTETELLANYPNPFNPETWIPYRLAEDAFVTLTIYDGKRSGCPYPQTLGIGLHLPTRIGQRQSIGMGKTILASK